jgi:hypothetical protein
MYSQSFAEPKQVRTPIRQSMITNYSDFRSEKVKFRESEVPIEAKKRQIMKRLKDSRSSQ